MAAPNTPANVVAGRQTAAYEGDLVVFLIGMRINRWRALRQWPRISRAMAPMLTELSKDPDSGLLGFRTLLGWREITVVQYWRDAASLQAFAGDPNRTHRPAWIEYFRAAYADGSVGIFHETYVVPAGSYESYYGNTTRMGLGAVAGVVPVSERGDSFKDRMPEPSRAA